MRILFDNPFIANPLVSFVLLDWSCRESFHVLKYLNDQFTPRDQYEIIWIEYYDRVAPAIGAGLEECKKLDRPPLVDQWIVLDIPQNVYYHKHLMYNIGIIAARGKIVTICDADVMVRPTFVESICKSFEGGEEHKGIVLHLDEVRNANRRFYPFNYPTFEDVAGEGCINWKNGKTTGLLDIKDPLHTLNYGACMSALHEDLVKIGGADEHIDYLGHICGPYEMTYRLVNAGRKEVWHQGEFLYHTWHPGTDGRKNYLGPHDGYNVSTTALAAKYSERVLPILENPVIRLFREHKWEVEVDRGSLLLQAMPKEEKLLEWSSEILQKKRGLRKFFSFVALKPLIAQFSEQLSRFLKKPMTVKTFFRGVFISSFVFVRNMMARNNQLAENCESCLENFIAQGVKDFAIFETGDVAETLYGLTLKKPINVYAIYSSIAGKEKFHRVDIQPVETIKNFKGKVVVGRRDGIEQHIETLKKSGIDAERIVVLL